MKRRLLVLFFLLLGIFPGTVQAGGTDSPVMVEIIHPEVWTYGGRPISTSIELKNFEPYSISFKAEIRLHEPGRSSYFLGYLIPAGTKSSPGLATCTGTYKVDSICSFTWEGGILAHESVTLDIDTLSGNILGSQPFLTGEIQFSNLPYPIKLHRDIYLTEGTSPPEAIFTVWPNNVKNGEWKRGSKGTVELIVTTPKLTDFYRMEFYSTCGLEFSPEPTLEKGTRRLQVRELTLPKDAPVGPCRLYGSVGLWELGNTILTPEFTFEVMPEDP